MSTPQSFVISTATPSKINLEGGQFPVSVNLLPGGGGTLKLEWSMTPQAATSTGTVNWQVASLGTVSAQASTSFLGISAIRVTAAVANGTVEVAR